MAALTRRDPAENTASGSNRHPEAGSVHPIVIGVGIAVALATIGYALLGGLGLSTGPFPTSFTSFQTNTVSPELSSKAPDPEVYLTQESVDLLLNDLDQAIRQKNVDGVLRHIAPDATITIRMKQGMQQQIATLTREEYRKTLAMEFAFPSANDFARVNTTVSFALDERSAKVSFKSMETFRHEHREFKVEGEETLVLGIRDDKPMITSLERVVAGDST